MAYHNPVPLVRALRLARSGLWPIQERVGSKPTFGFVPRGLLVVQLIETPVNTETDIETHGNLFLT